MGVSALGCCGSSVKGLGFRVKGLGLRVKGLGLGVLAREAAGSLRFSGWCLFFLHKIPSMILGPKSPPERYTLNQKPITTKALLNPKP